jgi:spore coat protein U-like protein
MLVGLAGALASSPALAVTCSFDSVTPVSFGPYDVFSAAPLDSTGALWLTCTGVAPADNITVDLDAGNAGTFSPRRLARAGGGSDLAYNLYLDPARTVRWGDGTAGTSHFGPSNPPDGSSFRLDTYGRVPALQDVASGSFSDGVVATINF